MFKKREIINLPTTKFLERKFCQFCLFYDLLKLGEDFFIKYYDLLFLKASRIMQIKFP